MIEFGLIADAKKKSRYDLLEVMLIQAQINNIISDIIVDLSQGKKPNAAALAKVVETNTELIAQLSGWMREAEASVPGS